MDIKADIQAGKFPQLHDNNTVVIGAGTSETDKKNGFETMEDGKAYLLGVGDYDGTNPATSKDLATVIKEADCRLQEFKDAVHPDRTGWGTNGSRATSGSVGIKSITFGLNNTASNYYTHAEGDTTTSSGENSHSEGFHTTASNNSSHAEGQNTAASGKYSHAEGERTQATNASSHAEGRDTKATGNYSHAEGDNTTASGQWSHSEGNNTIAGNVNEHSQGQFNISQSLSDGSAYTLDTIGYGVSGHNQNLYELWTDGKVFYKGVGGFNGNNSTVNNSGSIEYNPNVKDLAAAIAAGGGELEPASVNTLGGIKLIPNGADGYLYLCYSSFASERLGFIFVKEKHDTSYEDSRPSGSAANRAVWTENPPTVLSSYPKSMSITPVEVDGGWTLLFGSSTLTSSSRTPCVSAHLAGKADFTTFTHMTAEALCVGIFSSIYSSYPLIVAASKPTRGTKADGTTIDYWKTTPEFLGSLLSIASSYFAEDATLDTGETVKILSILTTGARTYSALFDPDTNPIDVFELKKGSVQLDEENRAFVDISDITTPPASTTDFGGIKLYEESTAPTGAVKLDGAGRAYVTIPTASTTDFGGIKIYAEATAPAGAVKLDGSGRAYVNMPDVTVPTASTTVLGGVKLYSDSAVIPTGASRLELDTSGRAFVTIPDCKNFLKYSASSYTGYGITGSRKSTTTNIGDKSVTFGANNEVKGEGSFAIGKNNKVDSDYSFAEGLNTEVTTGYAGTPMYYAHAEGSATKALRSFAHAEGIRTQALGEGAHAEGAETQANGQVSHAEGGSAKSQGDYSHAEGYGTTTNGNYSHAEGFATTATGTHSHAEGNFGIALGNYSHVEGEQTLAQGTSSHAEGHFTITTNSYEHAMGIFNLSHVHTDETGGTLSSIGIGTSEANRKNAYELLDTGEMFVIGVGNYDGTNAGQEGVKDIASAISFGGCHLAEFIDATTPANIGWGTDGSRATGSSIGKKSITFGINNTASSEYTFAAGNGVTASGSFSYAEGSGTQALGNAAHVEGWGTIATLDCSHAQGQWNVSNANTIDSIGIGTSDTDRKNATEVTADGKSYILGVGGYDGTNSASADVKDLAAVVSSLNCNFEKFGNGYGTKSSRLEGSTYGYGSVTFGSSNAASGSNTLVQGSSNTVSGSNTLVQGSSNTVSGSFALVTGASNTVTGRASVAFGDQNTINSTLSLAIGASNKLIGDNTVGYAYAMGIRNEASADYAFAHGVDNTANAIGAFAIGDGNTATNTNSVAFGKSNASSGEYSFAMGQECTATGNASFALGFHTQALHDVEHAQGLYNASHQSGDTFTLDSIGGGNATTRRNITEVLSDGRMFLIGAGGYDGTNPFSATDVSTLLGNSGNLQAYTPGLTSGGKNAITGYGTDTSRMENSTIGDASVTFGKYNTASNYCSVAFGNSTLATGEHSFAEGSGSRAEGSMSHAEGWGARACGRGSHAEGQSTETTNECEHAQGRFNMSHAHTIDSIGIGNNTDDRRNATEVTDDGKMYVLGIGNYNGRNTGTSGVKDLASEFHWLQTRIAELEAKLGGK